MRFEFSAGGIVFKTSNSNIQDQKSNIFILMCQHSQNHSWGFPKGLIGDKKEFENEGKSASVKSSGETKEEAALREVEEETGAKGKILQPLEPITYWYKFNGEKIKKTVYYYIMEYISGDITKHDFEMENVQWVEAEKVTEKLTFKGDKEVFEKAKKRIEGLVFSD